MYPWDIQYGKKTPRLLSGTTSAILDSMDEALKKPGVGPLSWMDGWNVSLGDTLCQNRKDSTQEPQVSF